MAYFKRIVQIGIEAVNLAQILSKCNFLGKRHWPPKNSTWLFLSNVHYDIRSNSDVGITFCENKLECICKKVHLSVLIYCVHISGLSFIYIICKCTFQKVYFNDFKHAKTMLSIQLSTLLFPKGMQQETRCKEQSPV